jgi:hypothetical protein
MRTGRAENRVSKRKGMITCTGMRAPRRPSILVLVKRMEEDGEEEGTEGAGEEGTKAWMVVLARMSMYRPRKNDSVFILSCRSSVVVHVRWIELIRLGTHTHYACCDGAVRGQQKTTPRPRSDMHRPRHRCKHSEPTADRRHI